MVKLRIHNTYQGDDFTMAKDYSAITPDILKLSELCSGNSVINSEMYLEHKVFRGLRDLNGNGVLTGLTEVSDIQSFEIGEEEKSR